MTLCQTLSQPVIVQGHGLHTGDACTVTLSALPENFENGFWLHRMDVPNSQPFRLTPQCVQATHLRTEVMSDDGAQRVQTVEHLLAALASLGLWRVLIQTDGAEIPLLGGGSTEWLEALTPHAQPTEMPVPTYMVQRQTITGQGEGQKAVVTPAEKFSITAHIAFPHPLIGEQTFTYTYGETDFAKEIALCRTFALETEVKAAQAAGLIQGGTLEAIANGTVNSAVVYGEHGKVLNPTGLHFSDEAVRHKILDVLGDFALAGTLPQAHLEIWRPGHGFNNEVLRQIFSKK